jgi:tetratricopeptide (TPR) repeat protein
MAFAMVGWRYHSKRFQRAMRYLLTFALTVATLMHAAVAAAQPDPDALYRDRTNLARAQEAASIWTSRLTADPRDFESAWKLARATYWLGGHDAPDARRKWLERGVEVARSATTMQPKRPEGFFWMAANMGALAESFGMRQGLRYRGPIKEALETVLELDPRYLDGSADRALGRWYHRVPGLFGGDKKKAEAHLRKSLTYDPNSTVSHFFLAETLVELDRNGEAIQELQKVLDAPLNPDFTPEDREYKQKAADLLAQLRKR